MTLQLNVSPTGDYIIAAFAGEYAVEAAKRVLEAALAYCNEQNLEKLMMDGRQATLGHDGIALTDTFEVITYLIKIYNKNYRDHIPRLKIAIVGYPSTIDPQEFGAMVATNRGLPMFATTQPEEALAWLKVGAETDS